MIHILNGNCLLPYKSFKFSGGELQVKLVPANMEYNADKPFDFYAKIYSSDDLFELALVLDAIKRYFNKDIERRLFLHYTPYARQDRVCAKGESLSLRVFADFINSLGFKQVTLTDPHSDVAAALINNSLIYDVTEIITTRLTNKDTGLGVEFDALVSPDAGATKKVLKVAQALKLPVIHADKVRNPENGEITGTVVHEPIEAKRTLVVDDICDGGRTFIELSKALKKARQDSGYIGANETLDLYITHGIFSKGVDVVAEHFDKIYCPEVFPKVPNHERLIRI